LSHSHAARPSTCAVTSLPARAWQAGDGALANVALDRALADNARYSMALLREALDAGAPPSMARLPLTAEEVAASYDALEADAEDGASDARDAGSSPRPRTRTRAGRS